MKVSVVIPVYGAPNSLFQLYSQLLNVFNGRGVGYEIILIDDCCPSGSWEKIREIAGNDMNVKGVRFSRNFGQHAAISCGLLAATGDWIVVMDCDLQDDPKNIERFLDEVDRGYEVILGQRTRRHERLFKRFQSWAFYKSLKVFLDVEMNHRVGNFGIYSKSVIEEVRKMGGRCMFFPYLVSWLGFKTGYVDVTQCRRTEGRSGYSPKKAIALALEIVLAASNKPLYWSIYVGILCAIGSFTLGCFYILRFFILGVAPSGWTSLIVVLLFATGAILANLGILGFYVARLNEASKQLPSFVITSSVNWPTSNGD